MKTINFIPFVIAGLFMVGFSYATKNQRIDYEIEKAKHVVYDVHNMYHIYYANNGIPATSIEELKSAGILGPYRLPKGASVSLNTIDYTVIYTGLSDEACSRVKICNNGEFAITLKSY